MNKQKQNLTIGGRQRGLSPPHIQSNGNSQWSHDFPKFAKPKLIRVGPGIQAYWLFSIAQPMPSRP